MSRPAGPVRRALLQALEAGITGTYEALAAVAGVDAADARATLKEIRRAGLVCGRNRQRRTGRPGAAPAIYGRPGHEAAMDSLGHVLQVWR
jgi:predicted ArsR family transcriptional regulator